jgi:hypothetical protein
VYNPVIALISGLPGSILRRRIFPLERHPWSAVEGDERALV